MKKIIVGVSGASGAPLAVSFLKTLAQTADVETHLVLSPAARQTLQYESTVSEQEFLSLADVVYPDDAIGAAIASGTFHADGMVVIPCSMKTVAGIASGYSDNLLLRAADVTLKERRKLILVVRETPFSSIHLRNMLEVSNAGAMVLPAVLGYYSHPKTIADLENQLIGKVLDQLVIENHCLKRWNGGES